MTYTVNMKSYKGKHYQRNTQWIEQKEASFYFLHFLCHTRKEQKQTDKKTFHLSLIDGIPGLNSEIKKIK